MPEEPTPSGEYREVTLADLVRTLYRRKIVLGAVFFVVMLVGVSVTVFATPEYEASATVVPLEHQDIIKNWLDSRHAAESVVDAMGDRLLSNLFADRWDGSTGNWSGTPPTTTDGATVLMKQVRVGVASQTFDLRLERLVTVTVRNTDPALAADVANEYVSTLLELRPIFEDLTRQAAFDRYYDGSNAQEANNRAEVTAQQREYWVVLDNAVAPSDPVSPNPVLNLAVAGVLGLVLGVFAVFFVEWVSGFRAESRRVETSLPSASVPVPASRPAHTEDRPHRFAYQGGDRDR